MIALPSRGKRAPLLLILLFCISRVIFYAIGIRYDATPLGTFWQFLDPNLLAHRLTESLIHLHSQPPLFNLFLGIILKLAPLHYAAVFHAIYIVIGITILLAMFQLLLAVGISEKWAFLVSLFFAISPASIVFENWLFYDYPLTALLLLMTLALYRFARNGKVLDGIGFFVSLMLIILMRSLFHPVWVVATVGLIYYGLREYRVRFLKIAVLPLLLVFAFAARNYLQFGSLSGSTWLGQHLSRVTTAELPEGERARLVSEGKLTPLAMIPAFSDLRVYPASLRPTTEVGVPALDEPFKQNGQPNFNDVAYIRISKIYQQDAEYIALHYPKTVAFSILKSAYFYLRAPNEFYVLRPQNEKMGIYETLFRRIFYGELQEYPAHATKQYDSHFEEHVLDATPIVMMFLVPLTLLFGLFKTIKMLLSRRQPSPIELTTAFIAINLLYVSVIANIFEMGENNRIRFMMDPLFLILGALMAQRAFAYVRAFKPKRRRVAAILNWTRRVEPNLARQFRIF